ncbi:MAG: DUF192 domain-containing protein [Lentisphaeria bacterium]
MLFFLLPAFSLSNGSSNGTPVVSSKPQNPSAASPSSLRREILKKPGFYEIELLLPSGEEIKAVVTTTQQGQRKGLSGVKPEEFGIDEGMFFQYPDSAFRSMWMPDTYMNLDIFFLDESLRVVEIVRDLPHHPGMEEPPPIPRTDTVYCRYVLEMRADSSLAEKIQRGEQLSTKGAMK